MSKTGLVVDDIFMMHDSGLGHPESSRRVAATKSAIEDAGLMEKVVNLDIVQCDPQVIENTHEKNYIQRVKTTCESGAPIIDSMDTGISRRSYEVALYAVGSTLNAADKIMAGEIDNCFCVVRPPGHHAEYKTSLGFCLFNNVAIAARYLQDKHGLHKIAIIDWDVHHGNGTMHTFYEDPSVYYISTHQYPYYPGTGAKNETGMGKGEGYTLNVPFSAGADDNDYIEAFKTIIIPGLDEFKPEFILISAGYDAHMDDPLAGMKLSSEVFRQFTLMLRDVAAKYGKGRTICLLEGGYNLMALGESVVETINGLME